MIEFDSLNICRISPNRDDIFVYFIQSGYDGPVKIGIAINPFVRCRELQIGSPSKLRVLVAEQVGPREDAQDLERTLHSHFYATWVSGEWFEYDQRMIDLIYSWRRGASLFCILEKSP